MLAIMSVLLVVLLPFTTTAHVLKRSVRDESFIPDYTLHVSAKNISIGGIQRYSTLVNGTVPGPELRFTEGEVYWVRVYNDLVDQNTTIHWHGLAQAAAPFSDGTPLASQWPIPPLHFFDYELSVPNDTAGTYFYHSHVGFQSVSASGPLIVDERPHAELPYIYDDERTITLQELFNITDTGMEDLITENPLLIFPENNGYMVNGQTISDYGITDNLTATMHVIDVDPGKTYRMRFIGATTLSLAIFAFENHPTGLEVIEADGHYTKPAPVSDGVMQMGGGERYSVLFHTKSCEDLEQNGGKMDYYMQIESRTRTTIVTSYALLRYSDTCGFAYNSTVRLPINAYPEEKPIELSDTINGFLDQELEPIMENNFPSKEEVTRRVFLNIQQTENGYYIWRDSNVSWSSENPPNANYPVTIPSIPYLVALYQNETAYLPDYEAAVANGGVDPKTQTFPAKIGEVLEIVIQNIGSISVNNRTPGALDAHPWHAHGGHYYNLGSGSGAWSEEVMEEQLKGMKPVLRDTTMLYRYEESVQPNEKSGWRAWRLRIENPGIWMMHCHWLQHMIQGMQTVWIFGDSGDLMRVPRPAVEGYLIFGGNVVRNGSHTSEVVYVSKTSE